MSKSIVVTSGKGGVGKTTVTANLGIALASRGQKVVLVEGDIGLNNLDVCMHIEDKVIYDIGDVANNKCTINQSLVPYCDNLFILPATSMTSTLLTTLQFLEIVDKLKEIFDYVLIDCPAGLEDSFHRAIKGADEAIIVTTPHIASIRDAYKVSRVLTSYRLAKQGLIINRIQGGNVLDKTMLSAKEITNALQLELYGVIPESNDINLYSVISELKPNSPPFFSYGLIAEYIDGGNKKIYDYTAEFKGVFSKLLRKIKQ
ncbi:MAG TPA: septum site-determining protein MinD [Clostridia bacterium]|nr:septum site-determining protein MinD [Clostridia bacterium]